MGAWIIHLQEHAQVSEGKPTTQQKRTPPEAGNTTAEGAYIGDWCGAQALLARVLPPCPTAHHCGACRWGERGQKGAQVGGVRVSDIESKRAQNILHGKGAHACGAGISQIQEHMHASK